MIPLLLLDVDGVLNAFGGDARDLAAWAEWSAGWATADGRSWHIAFAPAVVSRLVSWQHEGLFELQWLTTWGHDANGELRELLGMPRADVAGTYQDEDEAGAAAPSAGVTHAAAAATSTWTSRSSSTSRAGASPSSAPSRSPPRHLRKPRLADPH